VSLNKPRKTFVKDVPYVTRLLRKQGRNLTAIWILLNETKKIILKFREYMVTLRERYGKSVTRRPSKHPILFR